MKVKAKIEFEIPDYCDSRWKRNPIDYVHNFKLEDAILKDIEVE